MLDLIDAAVAEFIGYPAAHYRHAHVLWCAHCWMMDCWTRTPRLLFVSPEPNCGKTTAMEITRCLVPRAGEELASELTQASFYGSIETTMREQGGRPTILYDQLDKLFGNAEYGRIKNAKIENFIETGFQKSGIIKRQVKGRSKAYSLYAPVALAGQMDLSFVPSPIISRSIVVPLQRKLPDEVPGEWDEQWNAPEFQPLRYLLRRWIEFIHEDARYHRPDLPKVLINRDRDKYRPLVTLADLAGGKWPQRARVIAVTAVTASDDMMPTEGLLLLWAIRAIFDRLGVERITSRDLIAELHKTGEFDWTGWTTQRAGIRMGTILRRYGIHRVSFRDARSDWGYERADFVNAWLRYPLPSGDNGDNGDRSGR